MSKAILKADSGAFLDDLDYLTSELRWLAVRARRIAAERETGSWIEGYSRNRPKVGRSAEVAGLLRAETFMRRAIDARVDATRALEGGPKLGLDLVCDEAGLTWEERLLLLVAMLPGLSRHIVDEVLLPLNLHAWGRIAVEDALVLLDPQGPRDWARYRQYLRPGSRLVSNALLKVAMGSGPLAPDSLMDANCSLSMAAFSVIIGDPEVVQEARLED